MLLLYPLFIMSIISGCTTAIPDCLWHSSAEEKEGWYRFLSRILSNKVPVVVCAFH